MTFFAAHHWFHEHKVNSYLCEIILRLRHVTKGTVFVSSFVAAPPKIVSSFGDLRIYRGSAVSLQCVASGNPLPQVMWTLDDAPVPNSDRVTIDTHQIDNGDVISYLNRSNVRVEDGGTFRCTARNQHGADEHTGRVNVFGKFLCDSLI